MKRMCLCAHGSGSSHFRKFGVVEKYLETIRACDRLSWHHFYDRRFAISHASSDPDLLVAKQMLITRLLRAVWNFRQRGRSNAFKSVLVYPQFNAWKIRLTLNFPNRKVRQDFMMDFFSRLRQNMMLECHHFFPTAGFLYDDEWMQLQLVLCFSVLLLSQCWLFLSTNTCSVMRYN